MSFDLRGRMDGIAAIDGDHLTVTDANRFRSDLVDDLVFEAVFNADPVEREAAAWVIWSASQALGCGSASIHELYRARGRGEFPATAFTVPAVQHPRRRRTTPPARSFRAAMERDAAR